MLAPVLALVIAADPLGSALRQDGYTLRPPQTFRMARMDLFHGTRAGAIGGGSGAARWLSAALEDGEGDDAATLLVSIVETPFKAAPADRDELTAAVVRHFSQELGLKFQTEKAELVAGPTPRVEVFGSVRQENQLRHVLVAAMAGAAVQRAVGTLGVAGARGPRRAGQLPE
jgi:hypothetical protein